MPQDALIRRLKALTTFRAFFVTVLLGSFFIFEIGYRIFPYPYGVLYLIIFLYSLTIVYSLLLMRVGTPLFAYVQFCVDVLSATALIFLTGGIESWFSSVLLLIVIGASIVLGKRAGYVIAILSSVLYGSLIDLQFYGILPIPYDIMLSEKDFLYNIFSHFLGLYLTAYLAGYLSSRLEKATTGLERKDTVLRDLARFNKEVIEGMPSGLFTTDLSGLVILFNRASENLTGLKRDSVIGKHIAFALPFIGNIGEKDRMEGLLRSDTENKVVGLTVSRMRDARGMDTGFIGIFDDLTELKRMQEEIKQKEKLADIGELAANMAHEIRNPIASLKGSVEMLSEDAVSPEHKQKLTEIALNEMNRLNLIITDFLSYSRPKPLEPERLDLNQMLDETIEMLRNRGESNIPFRKGLNTPLYIMADLQRLQQVFWNLGINAIEAMPDGGELFMTAVNGSGLVEITFMDTGGGISPENIKKIFYPFFTTKDNGTGLGLSIAYRIVEDHGGRIIVSSHPDRGTIFKVVLPHHEQAEG